MKINCYLNSIGNVKLFSYIVPNKFEKFDMLQGTRMLDVNGFVLTFLNRNGFVNDLQILNNKLIYDFKGNSVKDSFMDIDYKQMTEMDITYNEDLKTSVICVHTDDLHYNNCKIDNIKFDTDNSIKLLKCKLYDDNLLVNVKNGRFCIVQENETKELWKI